MRKRDAKRTDAAKSKDFFVSYNSADKKWAEWIAAALEADGYSVVIQSWDFGVGSSFPVEMDLAIKQSQRLLLVLSDDYLASVFTLSEWAVFFAKDPTGSKRLMFPVRVARCDPDGLLTGRVYCDLVDLPEDQARDRLLAQAKLGPGKRGKPTGKVGFPGVRPAPATERQSTCEQVRELSELLGTTGATFISQCNVRDNLVDAMRKRLKLKERLEYEVFFERHFDSMNKEELRQHAIIRGYTMGVLRKYNERALRLATELKPLDDFVPSLPALRRHLTIWSARYRSVIRLPSTCLVYVGVDEDEGFPHGVEGEIKDYLVSECGDAGAPSRRRPTGRGESIG